MARSIKLKNNDYIDSTGIVHNRKVLSSMLIPIINNSIYSTSEIIIGKWIDGKPIYRKVIVQALVISRDGDYYISHGISNFEFCTNITMHGFKTNDPMTFIFPYTTASKGLTFPIQVRTSDVVIRAAGDTWSNTTFVIILEYTKTTDTVYTNI